MATTYSYDTASRLHQLELQFAATANDLTSTFTYNPANQISSNVRSNDAYSWTGHGSGTTTATTNGVPQSANGLNQIGSWVSTLGYDAKGNLVADGTYGYTYSSENLLTALTNSAPGATQPSIAFSYDALMRLAVIDSTNSGFDVEFGYDGQAMVLEGLSAGRTRRYVHGPGTDEPLGVLAAIAYDDLGRRKAAGVAQGEMMKVKVGPRKPRKLENEQDQSFLVRFSCFFFSLLMPGKLSRCASRAGK